MHGGRRAGRSATPLGPAIVPSRTRLVTPPSKRRTRMLRRASPLRRCRLQSSPTCTAPPTHVTNRSPRHTQNRPRPAWRGARRNDNAQPRAVRRWILVERRRIELPGLPPACGRPSSRHERARRCPLVSTRTLSVGTSIPVAPNIKGHPMDGHFYLVERRRIELPTFALRTRRSPS